MKSRDGSNSILFPNTTMLVPVSEKSILAQPHPSAPSPSLGTNNHSHGLGCLRGVIIAAPLVGALALALWILWFVRKKQGSL